MIRNIIFDLGNVLISFRPSEYLVKNNYSPAKKQIILADIIRSREWLLLDRGELSLGEAIDLIAVRSSLTRAEIAFFFDKRIEIMFPLDNNIKLLPELKKEGYGLYYLSNFPSDIFDEVKRSYPFFEYFDGGIISAYVRLTKPDLKIFSLLFHKYNLQAKECFFIDDIEENVNVAISTGMKGFFTEGSTNIFDELLKRLKEK
jgi:HAD superfamily hydrolase (TIGR01509 family)